MNRRLFLATAFVGPLAAVSAPVRASEPLASFTGTVVGYDAASTLLSVNGRLGPEQFLVTTTTLVLLNNHTAATTDIRANDEVTVRYDYNTSTATTVRLFREKKRSVTVTSVSSTGVTVKLPSGAALTGTVNANSQVTLEGFPVTSNAVLVGRDATLIYEPGTNLVLSLAVYAQQFRGKVTAVDTTANTVTVANRRSFVYAVNSNATITRNGATATLATLAVGDQVHLVYAVARGVRTALVLQATGH